MTHTVRDAAVLLRVMAGADGVDDRCGAGVPFPGDGPDYEGLMEGGVQGLRVGVLREGLPGGLDKGVERKFRAAVEVFGKLGATVVEVSVPLHAQARGVYSVVSKMGNHMGMLGKASGRRQAMLTDLYEKKGLLYTPEVVDKVCQFDLSMLTVLTMPDECHEQRRTAERRVRLAKLRDRLSKGR
jgi:amidase